MPFAITEGNLRSLSTLTNPTNPVTRPYGIATFRNLAQSYEVIYRSQPNVRTVVDYKARQFGSLTPRLLEHISDTETAPARDHPLDHLLRFPHPRWSRARFQRAISADIDIFDNFVAIKVRTPGARTPNALTRIPPQMIYPEGGDWLTPDGFRIIGTGTTFAREDVVHIPGYNPEDARWGLSPIESLRRILAEDIASGEAREQFWDRAARMSGWISRPLEAPDWGKPAERNGVSGRQRFLDTFRDLHSGDGPDAGGSPIFEEGMEWHPEEFDAAAAKYIEARELTGVEVSRSYHIHPSLLGFVDASAEAQDANRRALLADFLAPFDDYVAGELVLQLLPDFTTDLTADLERYFGDFDLETKLRGDFLAEAEATSRTVGGPWMTRNEARRRRGLPAVPHGDDLITPLNVTTGGRASPADTAPGTPGLGQASSSDHGRKGFRAKATPDTKATPAVTASTTWAEQHATIVAGHVDRQRARFLSRINVGFDATAAFDLARSNSELGDDLSGLALDYAPVAASGVASYFGIAFDITAAEAWLLNNASIAAQNFNASTLEDLVAVEASGDADTVDAAGDVFDTAAGSRADAFGDGRVSSISNFSRNEAAGQGGARTKTWLVMSDNPRESHAALDGQTIPMGDDFDVGGTPAPWPGHSDLPVEEAAGCSCEVEFA